MIKPEKKHLLGSITPALLVIATSFIIIIYGILFILSLQFDYSHRQVSSDSALHIAEAGISYYRWHLNENPNDYQDGTEAEGPYLHDYTDPQGDVIGQFELDIQTPTDASPVVTITSTGWTNKHPDVKRAVQVSYGLFSLTRYAFLHNSNVWFSTDITINGRVFSNGGIRMDGENTSTVQSSKESYVCGIESGCNPPEEKPGVWGKSSAVGLWEYPVPAIDFDSIMVDFNQMRTAAQTDGLYLTPSGDQGYHIIFDGNVVDVYEVTGIDTVKGYSIEYGCELLQQEIVSESIVGTYSIEDIEIIFSEDNTWVEGEIDGRTTLAVARFPLGSYNTTIWIPDNLIYDKKDGSTVLGLISESDIVFGRDVPEEFEVNGALLAQNGRTIRHHYGYFGCKSKGVDKIKDDFYFYGSLISNQRSYWNLSSGPGFPASGFNRSTLDYDPHLEDDPPPYFPTSGSFQFLSWNEVKVED